MNKSIIVLMGLVLLLGGCSKRLVYEVPPKIETTVVQESEGPSNLEILAQEITNSLLLSKTVEAISQEAPPIVFAQAIKNKTAEHINMQLINETISVHLLDSGKFQFVDAARVEAVRKQLDFQSNDALVKPGTAIQFGKMLGAKYMLYGNLTSIVKKEATNEETFFKITMRLMELETGLIEWSDHAEINKAQANEFLGW